MAERSCNTSARSHPSRGRASYGSTPGRALTHAKIPKLGLREFFPGSDNARIETRPELGQTHYHAVGSTQFDRGRQENILRAEAQTLGVEVLDGIRIEDIDPAGRRIAEHRSGRGSGAPAVRHLQHVAAHALDAFITARTEVSDGVWRVRPAA